MNTQLDLWHLIANASFIVKVIMLLLLSGSVISWAVVFFKISFFKKIKLSNQQFLQKYEQAKNLRELLRENELIGFSPCGQLFEKGYGELLKVTDKFKQEQSRENLSSHFEKFGLQTVSRGIQMGHGQVSLKMETYLTWLATIGSISPYIGLLGTVWGIMVSFTGLSSENAGLEAVAPGIAEALFATALGLFAAIPSVFFYNRFAQVLSEWGSEMEIFTQDFLNMIERSLIISK